MNIHLILSLVLFRYIFFAFIIGLVIDAILALNFDIKLGGQHLSSIGFVVIMVATFLMYWAQTVNKKQIISLMVVKILQLDHINILVIQHKWDYFC